VSSPNPTPRRVRVERNIYRRPDGKLEIGYRDSTGTQRWKVVAGGITAARTERDTVLSARGRGERVQPNPRLKFGDAADRWLADQVSQLRPATQASYGNSIETHLRPRWGRRKMDSVDVNDAARLVRELRAEGLAESSIATILRAGSRVFKFAYRRLGWHGENPFSLLENGERAKVSDTSERRIFRGDELAQTIAASHEPWTTLFRLASVVGARESELLGLWWSDLELGDPDAATITFTHQVDRRGVRVPLKTEESKATLPLPRSTVAMLLEHKARGPYKAPNAFVFASKSGRALGQRNVLRELHRAQAHARDAAGLPTFPELFDHDERGHLTVNDRGGYVLRRVPRRELPPVPDFHALRHTAAMDCGDAEEARDLLRHKNSNVTRAVYRAHFSGKRREALRAKMEARDRSAAQQAAALGRAEVVQLRPISDAVGSRA
jgi:integrase